MRGWNIVAAVFCLAVTSAEAAGFRTFEIPANADGPAIQGAAWYPSDSPPSNITIGLTVIRGARDGAVKGSKLPLIVISHGLGGSYVGHHDTAEYLADLGYVVAAINHPGDTTTDRSRSISLQPFVSRPTDIKHTVDYMLSASVLASAIDANRIGFYGFSRGGYTGLVVAGANPDWNAAKTYCTHQDTPICKELQADKYPSYPLMHDSRVKAVAIADPLGVFFSPSSYAGIKVPVQVWASEKGGDGVDRPAVERVARSLTWHDLFIVPAAAHYAFLAPCSPAYAKELPEFCTDDPRFDRVGFHERLNQALAKFFTQYLPAPR